MHPWTGSSLDQTMVCRLFGVKSLSEPVMTYLTQRNLFQWNSIQNSKAFIHRNIFQNVVCKMVAILLRPQYISQENGFSARSLSSFVDVPSIQLVLWLLEYECCQKKTSTALAFVFTSKKLFMSHKAPAMDFKVLLDEKPSRESAKSHPELSKTRVALLNSRPVSKTTSESDSNNYIVFFFNFVELLKWFHITLRY